MILVMKLMKYKINNNLFIIYMIFLKMFIKINGSLQMHYKMLMLYNNKYLIKY